MEKKLQLKISFHFFGYKTTSYLSLGLHKGLQDTKEAFSSQKRTSSTSNHEISEFFFYFCGSFLPSWIRIWIRIPNTDPVPDPLTRLNPDPIRIRIQIRNPAVQCTVQPRIAPSECLCCCVGMGKKGGGVYAESSLGGWS